MAISYCSAPGKVFSVRSGTGVPAGFCILEAFDHETNVNCDRYGELMTYEEADQEGIKQGFRIEFRNTQSFIEMVKHFRTFYGMEKVTEIANREEMTVEELLTLIEKDG